MPSKSLDLVEICRICYQKKWFIVIFAICAAAVGLVCSLVAQKQYSSRTVFIVKSPMNMDRNHVFRQGHYENNDFFATANEIDNIMTISKNEVLLQFLVDSFELQKHYGVKTKSKAFSILQDHFKVTRNDTRSIEFMVSDPNPEMAAKLVNAARWQTGNLFRDYFIQTKTQLIASLQKNIARVDNRISQYNDTIASLRQEYQLYHVLLPVRGEVLQSVAKNVNAQKVKGMELLDKATAIKDQLIKDRIEYVSLINEYRLETNNSNLNMLFAVQYGWPSDTPSFPKVPLILLISFMLGLAFSIILVLLQASIKHLNRTES